MTETPTAADLPDDTESRVRIARQHAEQTRWNESLSWLARNLDADELDPPAKET
jgi:hypothetical protein